MFLKDVQVGQTYKWAEGTPRMTEVLIERVRSENGRTYVEVRYSDGLRSAVTMPSLTVVRPV